jgi:hypothetical protein
MHLRATVVAVALVFLGTSSVLREYAGAQRSNTDSLQSEIAQVEREVDAGNGNPRAAKRTPTAW